MPGEYLFENLDSAPSVGYLEYKIGTMLGVSYHQCSYHPEQGWLKIWFGQELDEEQQTELAQFVDESVGKKGFRKLSGHAFFEFQADERRWQKHRFRVVFGQRFLTTPQISFSDAKFDGAADIEVTNVDEGYFDFRVTSTQPKLRAQFNSVEFEWEAVAWLA